MQADLRHGDCLEIMPKLPPGSVDMVLTDPPYGTTACKWDSVLPFGPMWVGIKHVAKRNAAIVMTASQPFTSALVMSNPKMFKHHWIYDKVRPSGFQIAKYRPMMRHEDILVFGGKTYNPQMVKRDKPVKLRCQTPSKSNPLAHYDGKQREYTHKHPQSILVFCKETGLHPTQKPVALMEYLIRTYTNPGDTVLDFTMGSGTTGVACMNTGRNFIGIELDENYFNIACQRVQNG